MTEFEKVKLKDFKIDILFMIRVYTKKRHVKKIHDFLNLINLEHSIYTTDDEPNSEEFELGISYCYPRKISKDLLKIPKNGFVNFHPGPLPKYKGPNEYEDAIRNREIDWGVSVHKMTEEYDSGKIIKIKKIKLHEPPTSIEELGAISHYFLFELFKETLKEI